MTLIELIQTVFVGGFATTIATQMLKYVPTDLFEKNPRVTAFGVSVIAAIVGAYRQGLTIEMIGTEWTNWVVLVGGIFVLAAVTYNNVVPKKEAVAPQN
jgi:uncharacterized membrane protein